MSFSFGTPSSAPANSSLSSGFNFGGNKPATPGFGLTATTQASTGLFGNTSVTPAFGSTSAFGAATSTSTFGAATTPSFGAVSAAPAFGSTATPAFGTSAAAPAFGSTAAPTFGAASATPAFGATSTAPTFGATSTAPTFGATSTAPMFGATATPAFGASTATPAFGSTTTPAFGTAGASAFGATGLGTGALSFGGTTTASTGLSFGTPAATKTGLGGLGGFGFGATTTTQTGLSLLNTSTTTTAASTFGLSTLNSNVSGTQPSASATPSLGLGGLATSGIGATNTTGDGKSEPPKQSKLPNEISTLVDTFKEFVKKQKSLSSEVMRLSIKPLHKVGREAETTLRAALALRTHHALSALSVLATVAVVLGAGYLMAYLIRLEEESVQKQKDERRRQNGDSKKILNDPLLELRLHELRAEKYNGLVRLMKPGCRTIVVLVDLQSRVQLLSKFHKIVWPYRKNKTLVFAYLCVERNVEWFRRVLQLSLGGGELRVNARNCVGTVLALNPHRKYFCIYHAKHPECAKPHKRMSRMTRSLGGWAGDPEAGAFIGFHTEPDSSSDEAPDPPVLLQENLLDGLPNWLDRLFEGSTHRYYINYWPDMTSK